MFELRVENVTEAKHRKVLNELLAGEFSCEACGEQVDVDTFELKFDKDEYSVFRDELLTKEKNERMESEDTGYQAVCNALPSIVSVWDGCSYTVSVEEANTAAPTLWSEYGRSYTVSVKE